VAAHPLRWFRPACTGVLILIAIGTADAAASFRDSDRGREIAKAAKSQSAEQTYQQLLALEPDFAGDLDYDYLLGTAALDAGHHSAAIFALQRAVATSPSFSGARFELARAYYAVGDNESARREFLTLQGERPPPAVAAAISEYLDAIDRRAAAYRPRYGALVEAGVGYDSNANAATDARVFGDLDLNDRSQSQASMCYSVDVAGQLSHPIAPRWRLLADGSALQRNYPSASYVNTTALHAGGGLEWDRDNLTLAALISDTFVMLDGRRNNNAPAFDLSTVYGFAKSWQLGFNARATAIRFADDLSLEDVDSYLGSLAITKTWNSLPRVQLAAAITGGNEHAREEGSPFGRRMLGGRLSTYITPSASVLVTASAAVLHSEYEGPFFTGDFLPGGDQFFDTRTDTQYSGRVGVDWRDFPARYWAVGTQVTYIKNHSRLSLYEYDRVDAAVMLRREFR